jgi:hypothetical protein
MLPFPFFHKQNNLSLWSMEQSPSWEANSHSDKKKSRLLWSPKVQLPCSEEVATGPYPEPDAPSSHLLTL